MEDVTTSGDVFMSELLFSSKDGVNEDFTKLKKEVNRKLAGLKESNNEATREYASFLLEELDRKKPRINLIESIIDSMRLLLKQHPDLHHHVREGLYYISRYANCLK